MLNKQQKSERRTCGGGACLHYYIENERQSRQGTFPDFKALIDDI